MPPASWIIYFDILKRTPQATIEEFAAEGFTHVELLLPSMTT